VKTLEDLRRRYPGRFAAELGIELHSGPPARQQWFLAALLYGARISGMLAARTCRVFAQRGIYSPGAILDQGWDNLVALLDEGGYVRYDFKTADKLLAVMGALQEKYGGSLERVHDAAADYDDLERRLRDLAPGVGPTTVNIFLRELRGIWAKADPPLSPPAQRAAEHLGLVPAGLPPRDALNRLQELWARETLPGWEFADLEAALVRLGLELRRGKKKDNHGGTEDTEDHRK